MPDDHSAYDFYGSRVAFAQMWEKPLGACPGRPLSDDTIEAILATHARASAGPIVVAGGFQPKPP